MEANSNVADQAATFYQSQPLNEIEVDGIQYWKKRHKRDDCPLPREIGESIVIEDY